jgi:hypothetical protein
MRLLRLLGALCSSPVLLRFVLSFDAVPALYVAIARALRFPWLNPKVGFRIGSKGFAGWASLHKRFSGDLLNATGRAAI